jgi:hypothetical protein
VFIALVVRSRQWQREKTLFSGVRYRQLDWRAWRPFLPAWAPPVVTALGVYWLASFLICSLHLPLSGLGPAPTDAQIMYIVRMFSSGESVFYAVCGLFFTYAPCDTAPAMPLTPHGR